MKEKAVCAVNSIFSSCSDAALRAKADNPAVMNDNFDRTPGAGRGRNHPADPGLMGPAGDADTKTAIFNQREPLRQPRTSPAFVEGNISTANDTVGAGRETSTRQRQRSPS